MLKVEGLTKIYGDGTLALSGLSLRFGAGEIVALVGGSGCGKSTLVRLIAGLDVPSDGRILIDGTIVDRPSPNVGVVFQEPRLLPWLTVADNIGFGLDAFPRHERADRIGKALHAIGLQGYGPRWPRELSGGQAQRVALARALVPEPAVLLLDEPFSALDAMTRSALHEQVLALWTERRPTLLIATHDIDEAVVLADRVVVMRPHPGRVADLLSVELPRPRHRRDPGFERVADHILARLEKAHPP